MLTRADILLVLNGELQDATCEMDACGRDVSRDRRNVSGCKNTVKLTRSSHESAHRMETHLKLLMALLIAPHQYSDDYSK
jgi:hypothetical protein